MGVFDFVVVAALGICLAAAVGFRVFLPWLAIALAARLGTFDLAPAFAWMTSWPAITMLAVAAVVEIAAYYIPGVDHVLDAAAAPLAVLAGTLLMAVPLWDLPPLVKWTTAVIAGGGAAGLTHAFSALLRAKTAIATGGLGNPIVASGESGGALLLAVLGLLVPVVALALLVVVTLLALRLLRRWRRQPDARAAQAQ